MKQEQTRMTRVLRLLLGAVFVYAAYTKLRQSWLLFALSIDSFQLLPEWAVFALARTLPWLELALGALLIAGAWLRPLSVVAAGILGLFFTVMVVSYFRGGGIDCGCFGGGEPLSWKTLVRDGGLLGMALALVAFARKPRQAAYVNIALLLTLVPATAQAQINAGDLKPEPSLPFTMTQVATFNLPWRLAFLPDGRLIVTEKVGPVWLVTQQGEKTPVENVPAVLFQGQGGMLGVFVSPHYATDHSIYLTYAEPGDGGSSLALARARLAIGARTASLEGLQVLWRDMPKGRGGQFGAQIAFSPDNQYLYLTVGDRQRMTPAQDPDQPLGKILRLTLDGKPALGNPMAGKTGAASVSLINPPRDTELAKTAPVVSTYTFDGPNLAPAATWTTGHRTPYGLAFAPDGRLWEIEHGPRGGDELNLIEPGKNYGWPLVSYATNYNRVPIPDPDTRPDLTRPVIYWTPIIGPGNLMFYNGAMFPQWNGSALVGGMETQTLNRITFDGKGGATPAERWSVGHRIRDVEAGPDGALWMLEDANPGGLFRVTPK